MGEVNYAACDAFMAIFGFVRVEPDEEKPLKKRKRRRKTKRTNKVKP